MSKMLENIYKLKRTYDLNENQIMHCDYKCTWQDSPFLGISKQHYILGGEDSLRLFKADLSTFSSLEEFWSHVILVSFDGCNWNEIVENISSTKDVYLNVSSDEFMKVHYHYMPLDHKDRDIIDSNSIKECMVLIDDIDEYFAVCIADGFYFAIEYYCTG